MGTDIPQGKGFSARTPPYQYRLAQHLFVDHLTGL
jgi:hypothetical protein